MPARVLRTPAARADLKAIAEYIGVVKQSASAATRFIEDIEEKLIAYARQPEMGDLREDLGEGLRSFTFKRNYVVVYLPLEDGIEVLRIFHGAQDYPSLFAAD